MSEETKKVESVDKSDVEKNKTMAILAYFIFFLPLVTDAKDSKFAKFHANQGLVLTIGWFVAGFLSMFLIGLLLYPVLFIFWIMGILAASNGEMKKLPLIGGIEIIK
jgi:uncharacterized membrane protein